MDKKDESYVEQDAFLGCNVYPNCEHAYEYVPVMKNCLCRALYGKEGCATNGNYWCAAATDEKKCPKGRT